MCIANIVPRIMAWLFIFSHLEKRRVSILIKSNLSCILLWSMPLRTYLKKICLSQNSKDFLIFLPEIIYLGLVPFEVNFLYLWGKSWDFFCNLMSSCLNTMFWKKTTLTIELSFISLKINCWYIRVPISGICSLPLFHWFVVVVVVV